MANNCGAIWLFQIIYWYLQISELNACNILLHLLSNRGQIVIWLFFFKLRLEHSYLLYHHLSWYKHSDALASSLPFTHPHVLSLPISCSDTSHPPTSGWWWIFPPFQWWGCSEISPLKEMSENHDENFSGSGLLTALPLHFDLKCLLCSWLLSKVVNDDTIIPNAMSPRGFESLQSAIV